MGFASAVRRLDGAVPGDRVTYDDFAVTRYDIARFAHSIGSTDPRYFDAGHAQRLGFADVVAPLSYVVVVRYATSALGPLARLSEDGMPPDLTPPTSFTRRVAGESRIAFHGRFVAGDQVSLTKTLTAVDDKVGRSGPLTTATYELRYDTAAGTIAVEQFTRILR